MTDKIKTFDKNNLRNDIPEIRSGMKARVWQKVKEGDKERLQAFEGVVIAAKHGRGKTGDFTVRKISSGVGVERIFPFHAPTIEKIEILSQAKVRRAKLYYLRGRIGKKARMKQVELAEIAAPVVETKQKEAASEVIEQEQEATPEVPATE
ncbi:50S ribosomal protein L19 [Candidatus Azambacteria bacterium]|nr:50S ribosomal protein L19 [Candidatus Azambacteria bacterium]